MLANTRTAAGPLLAAGLLGELAAGCCLLATGCWLLAAVCWLLAAGCGCWMLPRSCDPAQGQVSGPASFGKEIVDLLTKDGQAMPQHVPAHRILIYLVNSCFLKEAMYFVRTASKKDRACGRAPLLCMGVWVWVHAVIRLHAPAYASICWQMLGYARIWCRLACAGIYVN